MWVDPFWNICIPVFSMTSPWYYLRMAPDNNIKFCDIFELKIFADRLLLHAGPFTDETVSPAVLHQTCDVRHLTSLVITGIPFPTMRMRTYAASWREGTMKKVRVVSLTFYWPLLAMWYVFTHKFMPSGMSILKRGEGAHSKPEHWWWQLAQACEIPRLPCNGIQWRQPTTILVYWTFSIVQGRLGYRRGAVLPVLLPAKFKSNWDKSSWRQGKFKPPPPVAEPGFREGGLISSNSGNYPLLGHRRRSDFQSGGGGPTNAKPRKGKKVGGGAMLCPPPPFESGGGPPAPTPMWGVEKEVITFV